MGFFLVGYMAFIVDISGVCKLKVVVLCWICLSSIKFILCLDLDFLVLEIVLCFKSLCSDSLFFKL
jgi:hypothetical protein